MFSRSQIAQRLFCFSNNLLYSSIPIPNAEVTLNGESLVSQGQAEKEALTTQLREFLDKLTKENMMTRQNAESTQMYEMLSKVPLKIYVG